jgi:hypothetical protein
MMRCGSAVVERKKWATLFAIGGQADVAMELARRAFVGQSGVAAQRLPQVADATDSVNPEWVA